MALGGIIFAVCVLALAYVAIGYGVGMILELEDDYPALCIFGWPILIILMLIREIKDFINDELRKDKGKK